MIDDIINDGGYSYLSHLIKLNESESNQEITNTVELFTFGNLHDYYQYKDQFISLNKSQLTHLLKLSLWDRLSENDGKEFNYNELFDVSIHRALEEINEDEFFIELTLLDMRNAIDFRIDQENNKLIVNKVLFLRDVYDERLYKMKILHKKSIEDYKKELIDWHEKIKSTVKDYSEPERTRKRKTSDNMA